MSKISVIDENTGVLFEVPCCDPRVEPGMSLGEFNHQYRKGLATKNTNVFTKSNWVVSEAIKRKQEKIMLKKIEKAALANKKREEKKKQVSKQRERANNITELATKYAKSESKRHARNHTNKTVKKDNGRATDYQARRPVTK